MNLTSVAVLSLAEESIPEDLFYMHFLWKMSIDML